VNQARETRASTASPDRISNSFSVMSPWASSAPPAARSTTNRWCMRDTSALRAVPTTAPARTISRFSRMAMSCLRMVVTTAPDGSSRSNDCWPSPSTRRTSRPASSVTEKPSRTAMARSLTR
jgi:hypothetical protein